MRSLRILTVAFCMCLIFARMSPAQQPNQPEPTASQQQPTASGAVPTPPAAEQIRKTVAFLMVAYQNGAVQGGVIGTCFFVAVPDNRLGENRAFIYLVTNRHVAQPGIDLGNPHPVETVFLRMNFVTPEGGAQSVQAPIAMGDRIHWYFPSDEAIDLAVLPLAPDQKRFAYSPIPSDIIVTSEQVKTSEVGIGDPVTFAGYFSNFPGHNRMEPIVREGVVAMMPEEKLSTTLHKQGQLFLADLHAFHGNSGSPVFVNIGGFHRGALYAGDNYRLLGVISGYYPESVGFSVPAATVLTGEVRDNSGIATIVPGYELAKLLNSPALQADRDSQIANLTKKP